MSLERSAARARQQARVKRLPSFIQRLIANPRAAHRLLAIGPFTRQMLLQGISPTPGYGVAQHDASQAIVKDALGLAELTDAEFELALRTMTPPDYRGSNH